MSWISPPPPSSLPPTEYPISANPLPVPVAHQQLGLPLSNEVNKVYDFLRSLNLIFFFFLFFYVYVEFFIWPVFVFFRFHRMHKYIMWIWPGLWRTVGTCVLYRPRAHTQPALSIAQARPGPGPGPRRAAMSLMGAVAFWLCLNHSKSSGKFNFNVCPPCHASHNYNGRAAAATEEGGGRVWDANARSRLKAQLVLCTVKCHLRRHCKKT